LPKSLKEQREVREFRGLAVTGRFAGARCGPVVPWTQQSAKPMTSDQVRLWPRDAASPSLSSYRIARTTTSLRARERVDAIEAGEIGLRGSDRWPRRCFRTNFSKISESHLCPIRTAACRH